MIFATVGTHEQPFDRLLKELDRLRENGSIKERIVMQTGFSTYQPKHCESYKLIPYQEMERYIKEAEIVITHGGPASFLAPLQAGKIPVVVPRQKQFGEHVNDHQLEFCRAVEKRTGNILVVEEIGELGKTIKDYDILCRERQAGGYGNNRAFNEKLEMIVEELM